MSEETVDDVQPSFEELLAAEQAAEAFRLDPADPVHNVVWSDVDPNGVVRVLADKPVEVLEVTQQGCLTLDCTPTPPCILPPGDRLRITVTVPPRKQYDQARTIIRYRFKGETREAFAAFRARRVG